MIGADLSRNTINARINRIRRVFRWGVSVELIPASVIQALETVPGLQRGRSKARETDEIKPAPVADIEAALPFMSRPVAAMVRLQLLTGCRTEEILAMRGCDLIPGEPN
jgi:integrase